VSAGWQRREVGRTRDAGWEIGVSKTIDRPAEVVWTFVTSPAGIAIWLGEGVTVLPERGAGYETTRPACTGRPAASANWTASGSPGSRQAGPTTRRCS
jgi:hypothetical protein